MSEVRAGGHKCTECDSFHHQHVAQQCDACHARSLRLPVMITVQSNDGDYYNEKHACSTDCARKILSELKWPSGHYIDVEFRCQEVARTIALELLEVPFVTTP
jgi:hypothetical protein